MTNWTKLRKSEDVVHETATHRQAKGKPNLIYACLLKYTEYIPNTEYHRFETFPAE